jgi:membrane associated rhomboid family serine protease
MLISILTFVGDNVFHLPVFQSLYLHHRKWSWWQPITCTFCHGDWAHLNGNIFLLLLFGRSVEDELGPVGLLVSYMFCAIVANVVSLATLPRTTVSLGASGAVFGLFSLSVFSKLSWGDVPDWRKIVEVGVLGHFVANQGATMSLFQNGALSVPKRARLGQFVGNLLRSGAKTAAAGGFAGAEHVAHLAGAGAGVAMAFFSHRWISMK